MGSIITWVMRIMTGIACVFALGVFVPIGGAIWLGLIVIATLYLMFAVLLSALLAQRPDGSTLNTFRNIIAFFPNGVQDIVDVFRLAWHGASVERKADGPSSPLIRAVSWGLTSLLLVAVGLILMGPQHWQKLPWPH